MDKTYFFMAGLPRSGSTLLSSILNQNPDIYSGPQTDFPRMMLSMYHETQRSESFQSGYNTEGYVNLMRQIPNNFYANIDRKIIIDKNRTWGTIDNIKLLDLLSDNVKIICPVRPILEILASFVRLAENNPNNFIDKRIKDIPSGYYRSLNDARCDLLMSDEEGLEHNIFSLASALQPEHRKKFHFVLYKDLVTKPKESISSIYDFLEIPRFEHNFNNLKWEKMPNETNVFGIPNMHSVQSTLKPSNIDISILSDYAKVKYSNALDILNPIVKIY
jgi:sulfotransferase